MAKRKDRSIYGTSIKMDEDSDYVFVLPRSIIKKPEPEVIEKPVAVDYLNLMQDHIDKLNELWDQARAAGLKIKPWVDWQDKKLGLVEGHSPIFYERTK